MLCAQSPSFHLRRTLRSVAMGLFLSSHLQDCEITRVAVQARASTLRVKRYGHVVDVEKTVESVSTRRVRQDAG